MNQHFFYACLLFPALFLTGRDLLAKLSYLSSIFIISSFSHSYMDLGPLLLFKKKDEDENQKGKARWNPRKCMLVSKHCEFGKQLVWCHISAGGHSLFSDGESAPTNRVSQKDRAPSRQGLFYVLTTFWPILSSQCTKTSTYIFIWKSMFNSFSWYSW